MKNKTQLDGMPVWFDGKSINEALFCEDLHKRGFFHARRPCDRRTTPARRNF